MATYKPFAGFAHYSVDIGAEWRSKTVATRTPVIATHEEWQLDVQLECTSSPVVLALIVGVHDRATYARLHRSNAEHTASLRLSFGPRDWFESDAVDVRLSQRGHDGSAIAGIQVENGPLKADPRQLVEVPVAPSVTTQTGSPCLIAEAASLGLTAHVVTLAKADTEGSHGRWRVLPDLAAALPESYRFLLLGHTSGDT
jgi:hypothetical protein